MKLKNGCAPDAFVRMNTGSFDEDIKALERGIAFFDELKESTFEVKEHNPLTVAEIEELWTITASSLNPETFARFVRAVEAAHGIV